MLKALLKKQLAELFSNLFRSKRKGKKAGKRSLALVIFVSVIVVAAFFVMFGALSYSLSPLISVGLGWLYFLILTGAALFFGLFGSVFNTFSGLYQAKDNNLLLSMPIPNRVIITARLAAVYIMGLVYTALTMIPSVVVYVIIGKPGFLRVLGCVGFVLVVSFFVLTLSCALGWVVAKIHVRLKNKSLVTVFASVAFIAGYYVIYFKAGAIISELVKNGEFYASKVKGSAYPLYIIGRAAEGHGLPLLISAAVVAALFAAVCIIMSHGFIKTATGGAAAAKKKYKGDAQKSRSADKALFVKELKRFTASPTYMLNSGIGTLFMLAFGVFLLIKGEYVAGIVRNQFGEGTVIAVAGGVLCFLVSSNMITAPSISLEGRSIWIPKSLPVRTWQILRAKLRLHLVLTCIPAVFSAACVCVVLRPTLPQGIFIFLLPVAYCAFTASVGLYFNLRRPVLDWVSETVVIKQNLGAFLLVMGEMVLSVAYVGLWFAFASGFLVPLVYMVIWTAVFAGASAFILYKIKKEGEALFYSA